MTPKQIQEARQILGPLRKFPIYFMDYPEANQLLDMLPDVLDEVERLQSVLAQALASLQHTRSSVGGPYESCKYQAETILEKALEK